MSASNTSLLIKRSGVGGTSTPSSLKAGELAYSYASNNFFIGSPTGDGVLSIGGYNTFQAVNNATNANTASTIVKRGGNGEFYGRLYGDANTADTLTNSQNFSISGGDITASGVSFNGSSGVTLNASLNAVGGLSGGSVGSSTSIPVITYGANGRILAVSSASIATSFTITDSVNSNTVNGGSTLTFKANNNSGITTLVGSNETVYFGVDNTLVRSNTSGAAQTINTDINLPTNNMTVGGTITATNLAISGNITYGNVISTLNVTDPIIYLASNNQGNLVDIGIVGHFIGQGNSAFSHYQHTGFVRDYNDNKWKLFSNVSIEPTTTVVFDANTIYDTIKVGGIDLSGGNLYSAGNLYATSLSLTNALPIASGGTNNSSFTNNQITYFNGTAIASLANTGTAGTYGSASYTQVITTDGFGRVSNVANTQIAIDTSQIISGTLGVPRGGTGATSFTSGALVIGGGTGSLSTLANTSFSNTGTSATNSTITSLQVDAYGRATAVVYTPISGLTVLQGGTGASTFTTNGIVYGNGTGALGVTAAAGTSDQTYSQQILTVNASNAPVWTNTLDGGTF